MKLYAGTTEQFRADARMHRIAEKLRAEYAAQIGHRPSPDEVASWQHSLMALSMLLDQADVLFCESERRPSAVGRWNVGVEAQPVGWIESTLELPQPVPGR